MSRFNSESEERRRSGRKSASPASGTSASGSKLPSGAQSPKQVNFGVLLGGQ